MHKFIIPLLALALLLVSCAWPRSAPKEGSVGEEAVERPFGFDGQLLSGMHAVTLHTSMGDVTLELNADSAPKTVTNFVVLARAGYYNGLTFHRVIPGFMIQGGDPNGDGTGGTSVFGDRFEDEINAESYGFHERTLQDAAGDEPLPEELGRQTIKEFYESQGYSFNPDLQSLPMVRGAVAMANGGPNSNGSQFFIVQAEATPWLEGKHTIFGMVTEGMEVMDVIAGVERDERGRPRDPVTYDVEVSE